MRTCLDCGETIRGRSDKKFCSDMCRNNFNNRLNRDEMNFIRNVQNILRRNRRILAELNPGKPVKVHRDELIALGFNFTFHTHSFISTEGTTHYYCFDRGYYACDNDYYSLVRRDDHLDQDSMD